MKKNQTRATSQVVILNESYAHVDSLFMRHDERPFQQAPTGKDILGSILKLTASKTSMNEVTTICLHLLS